MSVYRLYARTLDKINARKDTKEDAQSSPNGHELARNLSLSTIHEERTSQLYDTPQTDRSVTFDDRGEVSFSFDGKEVSVSLYETPDLTEEEALQIVEMYADQLSEHVTGKQFLSLAPVIPPYTQTILPERIYPSTRGRM